MRLTTVRKKLIFVLLGGVAVSGCILFFVIRPLMADLSGLHQKIQAQKDTLMKLVMEESSYKTARNTFDRIRGRVGEIDSLFPVREELVGHIKRLEEIAKEFKADFSMTITEPVTESQARKPSSPTKPKEGDKEKKDPYALATDLKKVEIIPYNFHLEGSFAGIIYFFQTLENQPFYSEIQTISIQSQTAAGGTGQSSATSRTGRVAADVLSVFYAEK